MSNFKRPAAVAGISCFLSFLNLSPALALESMVVTGDRFAVLESEVIVPVTVLDRDDIVRLQPTDLSDLLRGQAGLSISANGGPGQTASIFLRGSESDQVLVLVDGVRINSATSGTTAFYNLPVDQIERIEIVRGPMSSLYGSEAIGGVIQIFTRRAEASTRYAVVLESGSDASHSVALSWLGRSDAGWAALQAGYDESEGYDSCIGTFSGGCYTDEADADGHVKRALSARAGTTLGSAELELHALQSAGETEFDGSWTNRSEFVNRLWGARSDIGIGEMLSLQLRAARAIDGLDFFHSSVAGLIDRYETRRDSYAAQLIYAGVVHRMQVGADRTDEQVDSITAYTERERDTTGLFAQYRYSGSRLDIQVSGRNDDNSQFGRYTTGSLSVAYSATDALQLFAGHGTAFRAPTFNDLYYPWGYGNPDLQPEESRTTQLGVRGDYANGDWQATAFVTETEQLIALDSSFYPINIASARIRGLEGEWRHRFGAWQLNGALTLLQPLNREAQYRDNLLPRRPGSALRLDLDRQIGRLAIGGSLRAESHRVDDLANQRRLPGFATVDLRAAYQFAEGWKLGLRVENLADRDYQTAAFYRMPGRGIYLSVNFSR